MQNYSLYAQLVRPSWAPPAWIFGPVWTALYALIAISFGYAIYLFLKRRISFRVLLPFILNLAFNVIYTPIQFGLQNNILAMIDVLLVLGTLVWALAAFWRAVPGARWTVYMNIPYLLWVTFATALQIAVTMLN